MEAKRQNASPSLYETRRRLAFGSVYFAAKEFSLLFSVALGIASGILVTAASQVWSNAGARVIFLSLAINCFFLAWNLAAFAVLFRLPARIGGPETMPRRMAVFFCFAFALVAMATYWHGARLVVGGAALLQCAYGDMPAICSASSQVDAEATPQFKGLVSKLQAPPWPF